jgi:DNA-binding transcriptional ArsR family regulator
MAVKPNSSAEKINQRGNRMAVKTDLLEWVIGTKHEIVEVSEEGLDIYESFHAAEAAADLGVRKEAASNALSALKDEGFVVNPERGKWSWTGAVPVESEKTPRKRAKATPKDPVEIARQSLQKALEGVNKKWDKLSEKYETLNAQHLIAGAELNELLAERARLEEALDALGS